MKKEWMSSYQKRLMKDLGQKKANGVKKNVVTKHITHEHYKEALFGEKQMCTE